MKQTITMMVIVSLLILQGCSNDPKPKRGNPVIIDEVPVEDLTNQTFCLTLSADSTDGALVVFYFIDCGDTLMTESGSNVTFCSIPPLEEGYDVVMRAEWPDTLIIRNKHIMGFVFHKTRKAISAKELQDLINSKQCDINQYLASKVELIIDDALRTPKKLSEIIDCIDFGEWKSVIITDIKYDNDSLITSIRMKPVDEKPLPIIDSEEDTGFEVYDD